MKATTMNTHKTALLAALLLSIPALGSAQSADQKQLQAMYNRISALTMKLDINALISSFSKTVSGDLVYVDTLKNEFNAENMFAQMKSQFKGIKKFTSSTNKIVSVKVKGKDLICTVKSTYDMTLKTKKPVRITGWSLSEDTWSKTIKGWKLRRVEVLKEVAKENGKPIKM